MSPKPTVAPRVPRALADAFVSQGDRSPLAPGAPEVQHASTPAAETASMPAVEQSSTPERVKKTVHFPPALHRRLRIAALESGREVSELVCEAVEEMLKARGA